MRRTNKNQPGRGLVFAGKQMLNMDTLHFRRSIWEGNVRMIHLHNLEEELGLHTYTMKINQFGDLVDFLPCSL